MKQYFIIILLIISIVTQNRSFNPNEEDSLDNENKDTFNYPNETNSNETEKAKDEEETDSPSFLNEKENESGNNIETETSAPSKNGFTAFKELQYELNFVVKPFNYLLIASIVFTVMLLIATIASFSKVPVKKGYQCRCCQRFKHFFIILLYLIFAPFLLVYYCINGLVACLHSCFPDKKLEDCKLDEVPEPEPPKPKDKTKDQGKYQDLVEEEPRR